MIRKARVGDVPAIHQLINHYARRQRMLAVSLSALYERVRDFFVAEEDGEILACGALNITWEDLGEIRSLAVGEAARGRGFGRAIVQACLEEARQLGLHRLFVLTYETEFFGRFGFAEVNKEALPHKVWNVCINCPHFPNCDETAMTLDL
jgi:amino-acid N-acetyltransferase